MNENTPLVPNVRVILLRRIKAGSLLKLVLLANTVVFLPLMLCFGVLAFFGAKTVSLSGEYVTGVKGLVTALLLAPFFILFLSLFAWVAAYLGIRLLGYLRPIQLEYVPAEQKPAAP